MYTVITVLEYLQYLSIRKYLTNKKFRYGEKHRKNEYFEVLSERKISISLKICNSFEKKRTDNKMVLEEKLIFYVNGIKITEKFANTEVKD